MAEPPRPDGRRERSRQTRARIVDAASQLLIDDGYVAATIEAIAARAGVATQTVYYVFGTKAAVLRAVLEHRIVGDLEPVPVAERPWVEVLAETADPNAAVELLVAESVQILVRVTPIYRVIRSAAADPEVGALLVETRQRRREDQTGFIELMADRGHLRAGIDVRTAADTYYGLVNEDVFDLLTSDCDWTVEQFATWVSGLLRQQLVAPG